MLKQVLIAACFALPMTIMAQEKMTAQQTKMASCNKDADDKKLEGDARKKFMSECQSAGKKTQQETMTTCNKQAAEKRLAGDERKKFMSGCLSG